MTHPHPTSFAAATEILDRAAAVGFDWDSVAPIIDKLHEELEELKAEISSGEDQQKILDEFGDLLLVMVNLARHLRLDADMAMAGATAKFTRRFQFIENSLVSRGKSLAESNLAEMETLWQQAKQQEKSR